MPALQASSKNRLNLAGFEVSDCHVTPLKKEEDSSHQAATCDIAAVVSVNKLGRRVNFDFSQRNVGGKCTFDELLSNVFCSTVELFNPGVCFGEGFPGLEGDLH